MEVIFVSKWALTKGIEKMRVARWCNDGMVSARALDDADGGLCDIYLHGEGDDWHRTHEAAADKAEQMRQKKIASLKKQISKLEKLSFDG